MVSRWVRRISLLLGRRDVERAMDAEMRYHVDRQVEELVAQGMDVAEARRTALVRFGGVERFKEEARDARGVRPFEDFLSDLRFGLRMLARAPGFAVVAVLTLGIGIGANTAVFSVVNGVILRPLPYAQPDRVINVGWDWNGDGNVMGALSGWKFDYFRRNARVIAGAVTHREATAGLGERGEGGDAGVLRVSDDFFRVIGMRPSRGREFTADENRPGGPAVAVLSDAFWRAHFAADPGIVGSSILLNDRSYQVVGVMGPEFAFPPSPDHQDVIVPLQLEPDPADQGHNYPMLARLRPGVTRAAAEADFRRVGAQFGRDYPATVAEPNERAGLLDYRELYLGDLQTTLWVLLGAVALVLLIACANVANLVLVRGSSRRRELALRATLGAGRGRIARQVVTEGLLLSGLGAIAGLAMGAAGVRVLIRLAPPGIRRLDEVSIDGRVLLFTLAVAAISGLVFGLIAALPAARIDLVSSVREGQRSATSNRSRNRGRDVLIAVEAALAMMLLAGAGLLIESFVRLRTTDLGFDPAGLVTISMTRPPEEYRDPARLADFEERLLERLREIPGVTAVAAASTFPLERGINIPMTIEGRPDASEGGSEWRGVSADYFATLGLPLVRGRSFTAAEARSGLPVILVNESFAKRWFPDGDAIGQHVLVGHFRGEPISPSWSDPARVIIGIVADMRETGPGDAPKRTMFVPHTQTRGLFGIPEIILRTRTLQPQAIDDAVREVDPRMPRPRLQTVDDRLRGTLAPDRFNTLLMTLFACAALVLTVIGIYGVVSYVVRQRTAEIGIRMALGAPRAGVVRGTVARGMAPVLVGLLAGAAGAAVLTRFLTGMLHGVSASDPLTWAGVAVVLTGAGLLACFIPARRAAAADPMRALRIE